MSLKWLGSPSLSFQGHCHATNLTTPCPTLNTLHNLTQLYLINSAFIILCPRLWWRWTADPSVRVHRCRHGLVRLLHAASGHQEPRRELGQEVQPRALERVRQQAIQGELILPVLHKIRIATHLPHPLSDWPSPSLSVFAVLLTRPGLLEHREPCPKILICVRNLQWPV